MFRALVPSFQESFRNSKAKELSASNNGNLSLDVSFGSGEFCRAGEIWWGSGRTNGSVPNPSAILSLYLQFGFRTAEHLQNSCRESTGNYTG